MVAHRGFIDRRDEGSILLQNTEHEKKKTSIMLTNTYVQRCATETTFKKEVENITDFLKDTFSKDREIDIAFEIRHPRESNFLIGHIIILNTDIPKRCLLIEMRNDTEVKSWSYSNVDRYKNASAMFRSRFFEGSSSFDKQENISLEKILANPLTIIRSIVKSKVLVV